MPGQEKMVKEYYEKNPSAIDGIRGSIYEEKIIEQIKKDSKVNRKEITKEEAERILKEENEKRIKEQAKINERSHDHDHKHKEGKKVKAKKSSPAKKIPTKKAKQVVKKSKSTKKVSKK